MRVRLLGGPQHNRVVEAHGDDSSLRFSRPLELMTRRKLEELPSTELRVEIDEYVRFEFNLSVMNGQDRFVVYTYAKDDPWKLLARWMRETL